MSYEFADEEKWSLYRLEKRTAEIYATEGDYNRGDKRKAERARELAHLLFETDMRYSVTDAELEAATYGT